jgi:hypothetical protein
MASVVRLFTFWIDCFNSGALLNVSVSSLRFEALIWRIWLANEVFPFALSTSHRRTLSVPSQPVSLGYDVLGACKYGKDVILYGASVEFVSHKSLLFTA